MDVLDTRDEKDIKISEIKMFKNNYGEMVISFLLDKQTIFFASFDEAMGDDGSILQKASRDEKEPLVEFLEMMLDKLGERIVSLIKSERKVLIKKKLTEIGYIWDVYMFFAIHMLIRALSTRLPNFTEREIIDHLRDYILPAFIAQESHKTLVYWGKSWN